jgi:CHAD domain-containing protein
MPKKVNVKPNKSFRDNARALVPFLLEGFLSHRDRVVTHPRLKNDFHKMRIAGKTLRYAMEVFEAGFGDEFASALGEVKQLLDVMGHVHDCDVCVPTLQNHLREIRSFNRVTPDPGDKIRTKAVTDLIRAQQTRRLALYNETCRLIDGWVTGNFREKILQSMNTM